jgi:hypothetical protein
MPHDIGDETNGDKSCTLAKSNTNTKMCEGKPNFHNLILFIEKWQLLKWRA